MIRGCTSTRDVDVFPDGKQYDTYRYLRLDGQEYEVEDKPKKELIWAQNPSDHYRYQIYYALFGHYLSCLEDSQNSKDCMSKMNITFHGEPKEDDYLWSKLWEVNKVSKFR